MTLEQSEVLDSVLDGDSAVVAKGLWIARWALLAAEHEYQSADAVQHGSSRYHRKIRERVAEVQMQW